MRRLLAPVLAAALLSGCAASLPAIRGYEATLRENIHKAKHLGGMQCAPVELARAQTAYRFALQEISDGDLSRAADHLEEGLRAADRIILLAPTCPARGAPVKDPAADPWTDADGDGSPDADDKCPWELEDVDGFADGDGCPEPDNDGDGVRDADDGCPNDAEDMDAFEDEDGCPELDNDGDGFPDDADGCPMDPETVNEIDDFDGCPDFAPVHTRLDDDRLRFVKRLPFAEGTPILLGTAHEPLREVVQILGFNPQWRIRIEAHTDNRGTTVQLMALSGQQAKAIYDFLMTEGIAPERMTFEGIGPANPLTTNRTEGGRATNRRVEIVIVQGL